MTEPENAHTDWAQEAEAAERDSDWVRAAYEAGRASEK